MLEIRAKAALGDSTTGMPTKGTLVYQELANGVKRVDYDANAKTRAKVGAVVSTGPQRAQNVRHRIWADATLGDRVVAEWQANGSTLQNVEVRPCPTAPCSAATPIADKVDARVVSGPPIGNEQSVLLNAPPMPAIDHTDVYPAFTATPRGFTYIKLHDGRWGASVEVTGLKRARFDDTGASAGQKVCVESTPSTAADKRFGTRVYVSPGRVEEAEAPIYVDGVLSALPAVVDVRLNDEGTDPKKGGDPNKPWLWLHTGSCTALQPPEPKGPPQMAGITYKVLVKAGGYQAQQAMTSDPLGKPAIALAKPTDATPFGATVRALSDGTIDETGFDVAARIDLPVHTFVYRPKVSRLRRVGAVRLSGPPDLDPS